MGGGGGGWGVEVVVDVKLMSWDNSGGLYDVKQQIIQVIPPN